MNQGQKILLVLGAIAFTVLLIVNCIVNQESVEERKKGFLSCAMGSFFCRRSTRSGRDAGRR